MGKKQYAVSAENVLAIIVVRYRHRATFHVLLQLLDQLDSINEKFVKQIFGYVFLVPDKLPKQIINEVMGIKNIANYIHINLIFASQLNLHQPTIFIINIEPIYKKIWRHSYV